MSLSSLQSALEAVIILMTRSAGRRADAYLSGFIARCRVKASAFCAGCPARDDIDGADLLIYGDPRPSQVTFAMMYLDAPPRLIETKVFSAMPEAFRRKGARTDWADANRRGQPTDCFIEGPAFDADGNLYIVDIPFGRIFRIAPDGKWSLVVEYDGWPNGLKISPDGRIFVADYMHGIMELDAKAGKMKPVLTARNSESFKGCNDLHIASNGDIYFTDQGQTGLHDPTGRVYRLSPNGRLDCLIDTGISPNGLVLDPTETVLFVAMTRDNAVWRLPFMKDGSVSKVGRFCSTFGASGPDGLTMDKTGRLFVAHASLGHVFVFAPNGELIARIKSCAGASCTNVAIGGSNRDRLYVTESATGTVLSADIGVLDSSLRGA
jgi:gluconolactonase